MKIGENIRKIRDYKGISQSYLSDVVGISQKQLSRIENSQVSPTIDLLSKICTVLEVELSNLLNLENQLIFNNYNNNQSRGEFSVYNNTDVKRIEELYKSLLAEKDKVINLLENQLKSQNEQ